MPEYFERVGREVEVIKFGGVLDYFLILWDIINWADKNGIMHGIGRGSGGGSLGALFLMGLVEVDPMEFGKGFCLEVLFDERKSLQVFTRLGFRLPC